jgi:hypothetical protein
MRYFRRLMRLVTTICDVSMRTTRTVIGFPLRGSLPVMVPAEAVAGRSRSSRAVTIHVFMPRSLAAPAGRPRRGFT